MKHAKISIIFLCFAAMIPMTGCKDGPTPAEGIVGGGTLRFHSEVQAMPGDFQTTDGVWGFSIDGDGEGNYKISGSGNVLWVETAQFPNCSWEATAMGTVTLTGQMVDCELTFNIAMVWNDPQIASQNCPYELTPGFTTHTVQDVAGPFPLQVGARITIGPDQIWAGRAYVLDLITINSETTMCKIIK